MPTYFGVEFKLLGCLRILGRGAHCDDVVDCGKTTVNDMFKSFVKNYSAAYYDVHVYGKKWIRLLRILLPGCVGSMDVTHLT
jgi:hypothetical protein